MKILWCVTGAGHYLEECAEKLEGLADKEEVTLVFSGAGKEVAVMYGLFDRMCRCAERIILEEEQGASSPFVGTLTRKEFDRVVVAPCTANTVAKIVHGVADSLVTNIVAQAGKAKIPVYLLPTDSVKTQETVLPIWIDKDKCRSCKSCAAKKKCKKNAFYFFGRMRIDLSKCVGCRKCIAACPNDAVSFAKKVLIESRDVDLGNTEALKRIDGITVAKNTEELV